MKSHAAALALNAILGSEFDQNCNVCNAARAIFFIEPVSLAVAEFSDEPEYNFILHNLLEGLTEETAETILTIVKHSIFSGMAYENMEEVLNDFKVPSYKEPIKEATILQ